MKFRLLNDVHLEFGDFVVPVTDTDKDTVLIIAGDLNPPHDNHYLTDFFDTITEQFKDVIFVAGNHDFFGADFNDAIDFWHFKADKHGFIFLNNSKTVFDNVSVIGATMWTDFDGCNPVCMIDAQRFIADFRHIRKSGRNINPDDILAEHEFSKKYVFGEIWKEKAKGQEVVVVTHHAPTWQSVTPHFRNSSINGCYVSKFDEDILASQPNVWCHGHVHSQHDYMVGDCRVLCNARGYRDLNEDVGFFNPILTFDVGS